YVESEIESKKQVVTQIPTSLREEVEEDLGEITLKTIVEEEPVLSTFEKNVEDDSPTISNYSEINLSTELKSKALVEEPAIKDEEKQDCVVETIQEEVIVENLASKLVEDFGEFDPTLELSNYQFPSIELLKDYGTSGITINQEELEANKNKIVETLKN